MAIIKSYTDIEQSKKLAKILPLESADMWYDNNGESIAGRPEVRCCSFVGLASINIPCWSFAALLGVLPKEIVYDKRIVYLEFHAWENSLEYVNNADYTLCVTKSYDNPIDACVAMIVKLHEMNLL